MEGILHNQLRNGNFTSSKIFELCTSGKKAGELSEKARKYINKKNIERKLRRSLSLNKGSNATRWGNFIEYRVHNLLGLGYESIGNITFQHPSVSFWVGSPDLRNKTESVCGDIKCYEPENFAEYLDVLYKNDTELFKKEYPKEYWQLVSNAIIIGMNYIEPIVYMPYESELPEIREMVHEYDGEDIWKYRFIVESPISELPYLPNDCKYYKNLNVIRFEVPQSDKDFLTERVIEAGKLLINI